ncbi:MAG: hypothetical protein RIK87_24050, partial [Fuerstiella sp.]
MTPESKPVIVAGSQEPGVTSEACRPKPPNSQNTIADSVARLLKSLRARPPKNLLCGPQAQFFGARTSKARNRG